MQRLKLKSLKTAHVRKTIDMAENVKKGTRDIIQFISSLITLIAGIVLVFLGFFAVPIGVIDYTVITAFGLFLSFVGAVWHIDLKYDFKTKEIEREIKKDKEVD